ncbi:MAG: S41 family peptidase [Raineya sp.]|jgi:ribosomal protein S9|nr:S41 family peptidase [Raineya sp.]
MRYIFVILLFTSIYSFAQKNVLSQPEKDFEAFWTTFKDNYAFFKLKGVNWDSTYQKYRPLINQKTTNKELIAVLIQMVEPLKDSHVTISQKDEILFKGKRESYFKQEFKGLEKEFWQVSLATLKNNGFNEPKGVGPIFRDEHLYYYAQNKDIGYIRITRCFADIKGIMDDKNEAKDIKTMLILFDEILKSLSNTKGLIIDIRTNGGGHGGELLASRFAIEKRLTHYKAIRQKGNYDTFSDLQPFYITPNESMSYKNPVIILTSDKTASSAEDFTIALYEQANVTTVGSNTSGSMSDMFEAQLSNKVSFTLSNQSYYSKDKKLLEDIGVPVKIEIKHTKKDLENKIDPVIIKAIQAF